MSQVTRFCFPEGVDHDNVEEDICLAFFVSECLHGRPQARLESSYLIAADGRSGVVRSTGPAGETLLRVFTGLCNERFGEDGFRVERVVSAEAER